MSAQQDPIQNLIHELHLIYLDQQNGNLHDALKRFLKQHGISDPDKDPRTKENQPSITESEKEEAQLQEAYENSEVTRMVYIEFDSAGYYQDPLLIRCVQTTPDTLSGIIKTHEGKYKRVSISQTFHISNHLDTSPINKPKCYIFDNMEIWEKTKIHKNYQEFDYNFDYDFGDL